MVVESKSKVSALIVKSVPTLLKKLLESPCRLKSPLPLNIIPFEDKSFGTVEPIAIVPPSDDETLKLEVFKSNVCDFRSKDVPLKER